jgi:ankyrin repeat protein
MSAWREKLSSVMRSGNAGEVRDAIEEGVLAACLEAPDSKGRTALHEAVIAGRHSIAQALVDAGANINACSKEMPSPLQLAALNDLPGMLNFLVEAGALIDLPSAAGCTALHHVAASSSRFAPAMCDTLLSAGARADAVDCEGLTPLHQAARIGSRASLQVIEKLAAKGANLNALTVDGETPLHSVSSAEGFQLLLDLGADLYFRPKSPPAGYATPLDAGADSEWDEVKEFCRKIMSRAAEGAIVGVLKDGVVEGPSAATAPRRTAPSL